MNTQRTREYYLDWIRVCIVLILVPFHAAVTFSHIGKGYIYTEKPVSSFLFIFISDFFNLWFMRTLFFISGVSAYMALQKRTLTQFAGERIKRLLFPVLFCLFTVGPVSGYILAISRDGFSGSFLQYYSRFFIYSEKYLFWGHMWFCVYLFVFSLAALPLFSFLLKKRSIAHGINAFLLKGNRLYLPVVLIVVLEAILRPFYPGYQSFIGDWANVCIHFSFLLLGFILGQNREIFEKITQKRILFLTGALISTFFYFLFKRLLKMDESYGLSVLLSALWGCAAYSWTLTVIGFFKKYVNRNNRILMTLSNSSFSLYTFHYLLASLWNFILLRTGWNPVLIWSLSIAGTLFSFFILFELVLKRISFLRYILGIKKGIPMLYFSHGEAIQK